MVFETIMDSDRFWNFVFTYSIHYVILTCLITICYLRKHFILKYAWNNSKLSANVPITSLIYVIFNKLKLFLTYHYQYEIRGGQTAWKRIVKSFRNVAGVLLLRTVIINGVNTPKLFFHINMMCVGWESSLAHPTICCNEEEKVNSNLLKNCFIVEIT